MTDAERDAYLAEFDRRWRERTPARDIMDILPDPRVGRSEMQAWFMETYGRKLSLDEAMALNASIKRLFKGYRREFPDEKW